MRIFNFSAGPAVLPTAVLEQVRDELLDWHGSFEETLTAEETRLILVTHLI